MWSSIEAEEGPAKVLWLRRPEPPVWRQQELMEYRSHSKEAQCRSGDACQAMERSFHPGRSMGKQSRSGRVREEEPSSLQLLQELARWDDHSKAVPWSSHREPGGAASPREFQSAWGKEQEEREASAWALQSPRAAAAESGVSARALRAPAEVSQQTQPVRVALPGQAVSEQLARESKELRED